MDYGGWCDRSDLSVRRVIQDVQFITAMNPRAGSFTINPRLQRHFSLLCIEMPQDSDLDLVYVVVHTLNGIFRVYFSLLGLLGAFGAFGAFGVFDFGV